MDEAGPGRVRRRGGHLRQQPAPASRSCGSTNLTPSGRAAGFRLEQVARQVRQAFYGDEAQRLQRGRDEVKVMVRYPEDERRFVV